MANRSTQYRVTIPENYLSKTDLGKIVSELSEDDQKTVERNCSRVEDNRRQVRKESGGQAKAMFGRGSSMELLSKLGIFMIARERSDGDPNKLNLRKPSVMTDLLDSID